MKRRAETLLFVLPVLVALLSAFALTHDAAACTPEAALQGNAVATRSPTAVQDKGAT
jgi:hypothetical protein